MTVKELIEALQQMPPDAEVQTGDGEIHEVSIVEPLPETCYRIPGRRFTAQGILAPETEYFSVIWPPDDYAPYGFGGIRTGAG